LIKIYTLKFKNDLNQEYILNVSEEADIHLLEYLRKKYISSEDLNNSDGYEISFNVLETKSDKDEQKKTTGIILEQSRPFIPEKIPIGFKKYCDEKNIKISGTKSMLIVSADAHQESVEITDWGRKTRNNINEQMGLMIGNIFAKNNDVFVGYVRHFVMSETWGSRISIDVGHSDWAYMQKKIEQFNTQDKKEHRIIGWWHTHPEMQLFLSQTDINTQKKYFGKKWQFAMVMNPQHEISCAYCGGSPIKEAELIVLG